MPIVGGPFSPLRVGDAQPTDRRSRTFRRVVSANSYVIVLSGAGSLSTPSSGSLNITGDIDIAVRVKIEAGSNGRVACKGYPGVYCFGVTSAVVWSEFNVGGGAFYPTSFAHGVSAGTITWLRLTRVAASGVVTYYKAADSAGLPSSWTTINSTTSTTGSLATNAAVLSVSSATGGAEAFETGVYRMVVQNGIGGTTVADFNPNLYTSGSTFTSTDGLVYTLTGTAAITKA